MKMSTRIADFRERLKLQEQELEQQQARHAEELAEKTQKIQDRVAEAIKNLFAKTNESIHEDDLLEGIQMAIHPASGKDPEPQNTGASKRAPHYLQRLPATPLWPLSHPATVTVMPTPESAPIPPKDSSWFSAPFWNQRETEASDYP